MNHEQEEGAAAYIGGLGIAPANRSQRGNDNQAPPSADSRYRAEEDLVNILSQDDPNRMRLTEREHEWAVDIKEMVEGLPDLDDLPDFMYAQLALVCKNNNMAEVIRMCYGLQDFRQEYGLVDDYAEGSRWLEKVVQLFPEHPLSYSFSPRDGTYVFLHDMSKFEPNAITSAEPEDDWIKSMYFWHHVFNPDLESIRKGVIVLVECKGVSMRRDALGHFSKLFSRLLAYYPQNGAVRHYNTGVMVNVVCSMLRKLLPKHLRDSFRVGLTFDGDLGATFLAPSVEEANRRLLGEVRAILKRRYDNQKAFQL